MKQQKCNCAAGYSVKLARAEDYAPFKKLLDKGKHPAFIGRGTFARNSENGGSLLYYFRGEIVAVSLINPHHGILLALNVHPDHRSHGLGTAIVKFLMPNFVRAIESRVPWFELLGYRKVGALKKGQSLNTQAMARAALFSLAGNLNRVFGGQKK